MNKYVDDQIAKKTFIVTVIFQNKILKSEYFWLIYILFTRIIYQYFLLSAA